jgi:hypothetical protein
VPKRYVRGDRAFGRLIKQLPQTVTNEIRQQLNQTGRTALALEQRRVSVRTGAVKNALSYKVPPVRLQLKVGLIGKPLNRRLFYGWIVEWGRKASVVTVTRAGTLGRAQAAGLNVRGGAYKDVALSAGIGGAYQLHVKPLPPRHFVYVAGVREQLYAPYKSIWNNALKRAAAGAGGDD